MAELNKDCQHCDECCNEYCHEECGCVYSCGCCCHIMAVLAPSRCIPRGTIMAQRQSDGKWDAFDPNADNGLQYPRGVARYTVETDEQGRINNKWLPHGITCGELYTNVYICGTFRIEETIGDLAAALSHEGFGRLLEGFVGGTGVWKLL